MTTQASAGSVRNTVLHDIHCAAGARMAEFAGFHMPLWYTTAADEHQAVRSAAGLFDCTHMGVLGCSGTNAAGFLDAAGVNRIADMPIGAARYDCLLRDDAAVVDDLMVYRQDDDRFMLVVNAANTAAVLEHLVPLTRGADDRVSAGVTLGPLDLVDLAVQGPAAMEVLKRVLDNDAAAALTALEPFHFMTLADSAYGSLCIARTGYTGSAGGLEIYVAASRAAALWNDLLEHGKGQLVPCGLAARDSLRLEAGLPLYGHELAGPFDIDPVQAGYGWAVKMDKPFFIGKAALAEKMAATTTRVARLSFDGGKGVRPIRMFDGIVDDTGCCCGHVLSAVGIDGVQIVLARVDAALCKPDMPVGLTYAARNERQVQQGRAKEFKIGDSTQADLHGKVLPRFYRAG